LEQSTANSERGFTSTWGPRGQLIVTIVVLVLYSMFGLFRLNFSDFQVDEGRFGISALNIISDVHQLATVSEEPLGPPGTKPYLYPVLVAGSISVLGKNNFAVRFVNVLLLALAAAFVYFTIRLLTKDRTLSLIGFGLFLLNPGTLSYARTAMPEPSVVFWGTAAIYACAKFYESGVMIWALVCGFMLGLGFLSKLWLVFPFGLACLALFAIKLIKEKKIRYTLVPLLGFLVFLVVAGSHLTLVRILEPKELGSWLGMYFKTTLSSRTGGTGYDPAMWFQPWWFYFASFFKASFFGFPLLLLGFQSVRKRQSYAVAAVALCLLVSLPLLSLFKVKEAAYLFPAYPGMIILMAFGLVYLWQDATDKEVVIVTFIAALVAPWIYTKKVFGLPELVMIEVLYLLYFAVGLVSRRYANFARCVVTVAIAMAMLTTSVVAVRRDMHHRTYYREIAQYFAGALRDEKPQQIVFVAPEFPSLEFYAFRTGQYWQTFYFQEDAGTFERHLIEGQLRFCIVDPTNASYGGKISAEKWRTLQLHSSEVTPEVEAFVGHRLAFRIFVPSDKSY
jgi:4-amino-4-deoxy-L-arabinose transferase-like glycosyltransferase